MKKRNVLLLICLLFAAYIGIILSSRHQKAIPVPAFVKKQSSAASRSDVKLYSSSEEIAWEKIIKKDGGEQAYQEFKQSVSGFDRGRQHIQAHIFGTALYNVIGYKGATVCDESYSYGCFHSLFIATMIKNGLSVVPTIDTSCEHALSEVTRLRCLHGLGHGILYYLGRDKVTEALQKCTTLTYNPTLRGCMSGVFMEYNVGMASDYNADIRHYDQKNPTAPCPNMPQAFQTTCYNSLPIWWRFVIPGSNKTESMGKFCQSAKTIEAQNACYFGIGGNSLGYDVKDIPNAIAACKLLPTSNAIAQCLAGETTAAKAAFAFRPYASQFCDSLSEPMRSYCQRTVPNLDYQGL